MGVGVGGGPPSPSLTRVGHQKDSVISAFFLAYSQVFNKKEERHGQVHTDWGLTPIFLEMSILSPEQQR